MASNQILFGLFFATPSLIFAGSATAAEAGYTPMATSVYGVKVTATLMDTSPKAKSWDIEVVLENDAHPLNEVMDTTSVLMANKKQYFPLGWTGTPPGNTKRRGVLHFNPIVPKPAAVELRILMNGESLPRSYTWRLK